MPAEVPSVTSAEVSPSVWTSSLGTETAGKISARRSVKSRAAEGLDPPRWWSRKSHESLSQAILSERGCDRNLVGGVFGCVSLLHGEVAPFESTPQVAHCGCGRGLATNLGRPTMSSRPAIGH